MQSPRVEVQLPGSRLKEPLPAPRQVRILQSEYCHEVVEITYPYSERIRTLLVQGTPVKVIWGTAANTANFAAKVHTVSYRDEPFGGPAQRTIVATCSGATDSLNINRSFTQYRDTPVTTVASGLVPKAGLSLMIEKHPFRWPLLKQDGMSDWEFLVECAKKVGWTMYGRNTDVRFHSRAIRADNAPLFYDRIGNLENLIDRQYIRDFEIVQSESLGSGERKRKRAAFAIEPRPYTAATATTPELRRRPKVFYAEARPLKGVSGKSKSPATLKEYRRQIRASNVFEARAILEGEQESNRHHIQGRASLNGDSTVHVGMSIRLAAVNTDHNGLWYVTKAEHILTPTEYVLNVELGRDGIGDPQGIPTGNRKVVFDGVNLNASQSAPGGSWRSSHVIAAASAPAVGWKSDAPLVRALRPVQGKANIFTDPSKIRHPSTHPFKGTVRV